MISFLLLAAAAGLAGYQAFKHKDKTAGALALLCVALIFSGI